MSNDPAAQNDPGGKAALPHTPSRTYRETSDVTAAVARLIRSLGNRIATEDPEALAHLRELQTVLRDAWATAVAGIRDSGATDSTIGDALGITRQAVEQRWPRERPS